MIKIQSISGYLRKNGSSFYLVPLNSNTINITYILPSENFLTQICLIETVMWKSPLEAI